MMLDKINALLESGDKEMRKLGQRLCHIHRISYYVEVLPKAISRTRPLGANSKVTKCSLNPIAFRVVRQVHTSFPGGGGITVTSAGPGETLQKVYKIELCKKN